MNYLVRGEFVEENTAGKPVEDVFSWIEMVVHPSLEMMQSQIQSGKVTGGIVAGERVGYMIVDAPSHDALGEWLRSFPFWGALKWTVTPLQSPKSAVDQDKASFARARAMMKEHKM
jgi:muconolactone delta-isomerase